MLGGEKPEQNRTGDSTVLIFGGPFIGCLRFRLLAIV
jgi:hypothetical protein